LAIVTCRPATSSSGSCLIASSRVEAAREVEHGLIALGAHALEDLLDRLLDGGAIGHERAQVSGRPGDSAEALELADLEAL
jgi:hypothetical protein